jgi:arylsulfatase A-like enzyme
MTYRVSQDDGSFLVYDDHTTDAQYSTDLGATKMREFVSAAVTDGRPFFAYWAPLASHTDGFLPPAPAARHLGTFDDLPLWRPPNWDETEVSDKPRYVAAFPIDVYGITDLVRERGYEALLSIDEQLGTFLDLVESLGAAEDTVVVLTSDNGVTWGEHGLFFQSKGCPYEECQRVPFVVHYPRLGTPGAVREEAVLNIDVAPTLAELAGISIATPVDGESLAPLLAGAAPAWRTDYLLEYYRGGCNDVLVLTTQPVDGDRVRLIHGDPWSGGPRPSAVFEFDGGDGVVAPGAILVPIQATINQTAARLATTVTATVPGVRHIVNFSNKANVEDATEACNAPVWWEEVDQTNALDPTDPLPAFFGVRDVARGYTWVEYETGERELYDLNVDPWQLENLDDDPAYAALRAELSARTAALRGE